MNWALDDYLTRLGPQIREQLDPLTSRVVPALREITKTPAPQESHLLQFEIDTADADAGKHGLPVEAAFRAKSGAKVGTLPRLLPDPTLPPKLLNVLENKSHSVSVDYLVYEVLAEWLSDCWKAAGGPSFPLRAVAWSSGKRSFLDLGDGKWIRADEPPWVSLRSARDQEGSA